MGTWSDGQAVRPLLSCTRALTSRLREAAGGSDERPQVSFPVGQQRGCYLPDRFGLAIHSRIDNVTHGHRRRHRTACGDCNVGPKGKLRFHAGARVVLSTRSPGCLKPTRVHRDLDDTTAEARPDLGRGRFQPSQRGGRGDRVSGPAGPRVQLQRRVAGAGPRASVALGLGQDDNPEGAQPRADALPARCGDPQHRQGFRLMVWVEIRIHAETVQKSEGHRGASLIGNSRGGWTALFSAARAPGQDRCPEIVRCARRDPTGPIVPVSQARWPSGSGAHRCYTGTGYEHSASNEHACDGNLSYGFMACRSGHTAVVRRRSLWRRDPSILAALHRTSDGAAGNAPSRRSRRGRAARCGPGVGRGRQLCVRGRW